MNGDKIFVDTNVLVYAYDTSAGEKRQRAKDILARLWETGMGVLSTQVVQEFFVVVTKKIPRPLSAQRARRIVEDFLHWDVIVNDERSILEAIDLSCSQGVSFWDALVVNAAMKAGAGILLSEDLQHGRVFEGVHVRNPFKQEE